MKTLKSLTWRDVSPCLPGRSSTAWEVKLGDIRLLIVQRPDPSGRPAWHLWCDPLWPRHTPLPERVAYDPEATRAQRTALTWLQKRLERALDDVERIRATNGGAPFVARRRPDRVGAGR